MLDPGTCTMKSAIDYAQELKQLFGEISEDQSVTLQDSAEEFLIAFLRLCHLNGDRIDPMTAEVTIGPKPANCERPGTSQTCYYVRANGSAQFQPVWLSDCRATIRATRLKGTEEN